MSAWPFGDIRPFSAQVIVADPPWSFALRSAKGEGKSAQAHYACMALADIKAMPVDQLARDGCWLFLWVTAPMLREGFEVLDAWRFSYVTRIAWRKLWPSGKPKMGTGYVARTFHEDCLIGRIGEPEYAKALPSLFDGEAREHSRKPERFYELVEAFAPLAFRVELFARQTRLGWTAFGNEAEKFNGGANEN